MTSADSQASCVLNHERGGLRLDPDLERFASCLRDRVKGVRRGYVYYQTCKNRGCGTHEAVVCVNPAMWHQEEELPSDFIPWIPEVQPALSLSLAAGLPTVAAGMIWRDTPQGRVASVRMWNGRAWDTVPIEDFVHHLWTIHTAHAPVCGAPLNDPIHRVGTSSFLARLRDGTARINDTLRIINGAVHTDTDLLLVDDRGKPLLIVEEHRPGPDRKFITFSRRLSAQAGGGLVVRVETDGDVRGALVAEVWDTRRGTQIIAPSDDVRGYVTLTELLLQHEVFAPYIR